MILAVIALLAVAPLLPAQEAADSLITDDDLLISAGELGEVVINGRILKTRRSLKDNPAFAIINEIVSHIDDYRPATNGTLSRERRDVTSVALAEPSKGILKYEIRHHPDIFNKYLSYDALMTDDDGVVYVSCHEKTYTELFDSLGNSIRPTAIYELDNRSGETALTLLETALSVQHAARGADGMTAFTRRTGIDDFLSEEEIEGPLNHYIGNTDIFSGDICIIGERFPSPISHFGTLFYRFALNDTVSISGQPCLDIVFAPRDGRSFSFGSNPIISMSLKELLSISPVIIFCLAVARTPNLRYNGFPSILASISLSASIIMRPSFVSRWMFDLFFPPASTSVP